MPKRLIGISFNGNVVSNIYEDTEIPKKMEEAIKEQQEDNFIKCPDCGKLVKGEIGLEQHQRMMKFWKKQRRVKNDSVSNLGESKT